MSPWRKQGIYLAILLLVVVGYYSLVFQEKFTGLYVQDSYDYAQLARNLVEHKEFTTKLLVPLAVSLQPTNDTFPDLWRAPLHPLLIAAAFALLGIDQTAIPFLTFSYLIILTLITWWVARKHLSPLYAFGVSLAVAFTPEMIWFALQGLREPLFALVFFVTGYGVWQKKSSVWIGVGCGLCYLTRYNFIFFLPAFFWFIWKEEAKTRQALTKMATIMVVFFATISPWLWRNVSWNQPPLSTLQRYELALFTKEYPHYTVYRHSNPATPDEFLTQHPKSVLNKAWWYSCLHYWPRACHLPFLATPAITPFFNIPEVLPDSPPETTFSLPAWQMAITSTQFTFYSLAWWLLSLVVAIHTRDHSGTRFLIALWLGIGLQVVILSFIHPVTRHYLPILPLLMVVTIGQLRDSLFSQPLLRLLVAVAFLLAAILPLHFSQPPSAEVTHELGQSISHLETQIPEEQIIISNVPFMVCWYGNRKSLWLPYHLRDLREIEKKIGPINYFYWHSRGESTWLNTHQGLKEYLANHFYLIDKGNSRHQRFFLFARKANKKKQ